jgi:hypothetical protein
MVRKEGWTGSEASGFMFFRRGEIVGMVIPSEKYSRSRRTREVRWQGRVLLNGHWQDAGRASANVDGAQKIVEGHFIKRTEVIP